MEIEVLADADSVARRGAALLAQQAREAVAARGRFILALSGGRTPAIMLRRLADESLPWPQVHVFQVDERVAPANHPDRNLTLLLDALRRVPLPPQQVYAMPVEASDLEAAAHGYAMLIQTVAGSGGVLDFVHLGLGADGHTASLVPGDPVLQVSDADVALTGEYQGRRRMTLTYPALNRARRILWLVNGREKAAALERLRAGDWSIPAGRIRRDNAVLLADAAAERPLPDGRGSAGMARPSEGDSRGNAARPSAPL